MSSWLRVPRPGACLSLVALLAAAPLHAQGTPTRLLVRAVAHDAKIIGSSVGGARITVTDVATGAVLASGTQEGGTGNTSAIVRTPRARGAQVYDTEGAAFWETTLNLDAPTRIEVTAEGPLDNGQAVQRSSKTILMVPGEDIVGEGLILELNGFAVEIEAPEDDAAFQSGATLPVRAHVAMMCGCTIEPGGLWDAQRIRVVARLIQGGAVVAESALSYAGEPSTFEGSLTLPAAGPYRLRVLALDPERANTGMAEQAVTVH